MGALPAGLDLRRAGPDDAAAVLDLTRRAYAKWVPVIGREPLPMTADYTLALREHRMDLLMEGDRMLALVETVLRNDDLLVENLAVDPADQGRGLGQMLLAHVEALAAGQGRPVVRLYTNARFAENLAFYLARGYLVEREESFLDGTMVHFSKVVEESGR